MSKENPNEFKIINKNERLHYRLIINQLKQQLAEKEKELLKQKEKSARTEQIYNRIIVDKDKEIERLKFFERIYHQNQLQASQEDINKLFQSAYQSPIAVGLNEIAIQELEKVKDYICDCTYIKEPDYTNVCCKIDQQIKELKGEKE